MAPLPHRSSISKKEHGGLRPRSASHFKRSGTSAQASLAHQILARQISLMRLSKIGGEREQDLPRSSGLICLMLTLPYCRHRPRLAQRNGLLVKASSAEDTANPQLAFGGKPEASSAWQQWTALYDASVAFISAQIGRLKSELDQRGLSDTILVVSADHGEELGEHGDNSHRFRPYEHNVRIPLFFNHPDISPKVSPGFATTLDIATTICGL